VHIIEEEGKQDEEEGDQDEGDKEVLIIEEEQEEDEVLAPRPTVLTQLTNLIKSFLQMQKIPRMQMQRRKMEMMRPMIKVMLKLH
jgi:hypothetical protein